MMTEMPDMKFVGYDFANRDMRVKRSVLHLAQYNLVRTHKTLRMTPAMAAGVENRLWSLEELVERTSK
jgi:hypothetical protein